MADGTASRPACAYEGCEKPSVKRVWCSSHYAQWRRGEQLRPLRQWRPDRQCTECGATDWPPNGRRSQCSGRCQQLASRRRNGGNVKQQLICEDCGDLIVVVASPGQRKQRSDTKRCAECNGRKSFRLNGRGTNVSIGVVRRMGTHCGICGGAVDFGLRAPNGLAPSVDHIVPVSLGGSNEPGNLQLAHLQCNRKKNQGEVERGIANTFYRTYPWKKFSRALRAEEPDCRQCGAPAWATDHIVAIADGGALWDPANLQSLCRGCHNTKSQQEYRGRCAANANEAA